MNARSQGRGDEVAKADPPLRSKIARALRHEGFLSEAAANEAAFHLTDRIADLHEPNKLCESSRWNASRAQRVLMAFVSHAPSHLAAAHRIILDSPVTDVFEVGAVKGTGRGRRKPGEHPNVASGAARVNRTRSS